MATGSRPAARRPLGDDFVPNHSPDRQPGFRESRASRTNPKLARDAFAFERGHAGERFVVALDFGDAPAALSFGRGVPLCGLHSRHGAVPPSELAHVARGPAEGVVQRVW